MFDAAKIANTATVRRILKFHNRFDSSMRLEEFCRLLLRRRVPFDPGSNSGDCQVLRGSWLEFSVGSGSGLSSTRRGRMFIFVLWEEPAASSKSLSRRGGNGDFSGRSMVIVGVFASAFRSGYRNCARFPESGASRGCFSIPLFGERARNPRPTGWPRCHGLGRG